MILPYFVEESVVLGVSSMIWAIFVDELANSGISSMFLGENVDEKSIVVSFPDFG